MCAGKDGYDVLKKVKVLVSEKTIIAIHFLLLTVAKFWLILYTINLGGRRGMYYAELRRT